ncbi:MAG: DUF255 domain-containing protein [Phycisphaera sp.]|nr:DUF255 domain-containing protein [Phycisphaera sp.]
MKASFMTLAILAVAALVAAAWHMTDSAAMAAEGEHGKPQGKPNHLIHETSPYLLQHAHNPVDWYPWGDEAFAKAKRENKPIFLSVGYSTCHWCHVMAHESFENDGVAKILNEHYVCIKVDREELPDIDEQYMLATMVWFQMTGQGRGGGWPNSVWLMPDGRPWYAGTYFPREDRGGAPGFKTILTKLAEAWRDQPQDIDKQATAFAEALKRAGQFGQGPGAAAAQPVSMQAFKQAAKYFEQGYDEARGGFGGAPKFPPHGALRVLMHDYDTSADLGTFGIITHTLDAMAAGGVYDHVGGGFHRYSTDARWLLPHFEKMLYDNAQLITAYTEGHRLSDTPDYARVVAETFAWLQREMTDPAGGFYSAQDADSEGEEGKFYVWTTQEVVDVLGADDGALFAKVYGFTDEGNFVEEATRKRTGSNIPHLDRPIDEWATELKVDAGDLRKRLTAMRAKLLAVRVKRVYPHLDDKVLASWNGLMIGALAHAGKHFDNAAYTDAAVKAADFLLTQMREKDGKLHRTWRKGEAKLPGYLDDYAYVIDGLLELHRATGTQRWADAAQQLADVMVADFYDLKHGGFYMTSAAHDELLIRSKGLTGGGNTPNANGVAAQALIDLAVLTQDKKYAAYAAGTLHAMAPTIWNNPHAAESLVMAVARFFELNDKLPSPDAAVAAATGAGEGAAGGDAGDKPDVSVRVEPVTVQVYRSLDAVQPGETLNIAVRYVVDKTWHIYAPDPGGEFLLPTTITLAGPDGCKLGELKWPKPETFTDKSLGKKINVYSGTATVLVPVKIPAAAKPGEITLQLRSRTQACDDSKCLAPEQHTLDVKITIAAATSGELRHAKVFEPLGVK